MIEICIYTIIGRWILDWLFTFKQRLRLETLTALILMLVRVKLTASSRPLTLPAAEPAPASCCEAQSCCYTGITSAGFCPGMPTRQQKYRLQWFSGLIGNTHGPVDLSYSCIEGYGAQRCPPEEDRRTGPSPCFEARLNSLLPSAQCRTASGLARNGKARFCFVSVWFYTAWQSSRHRASQDLFQTKGWLLNNEQT